MIARSSPCILSGLEAPASVRYVQSNCVVSSRARTRLYFFFAIGITVDAYLCVVVVHNLGAFASVLMLFKADCV